MTVTPRRSNQNGFTLLEVMVAVAVLAVAFVVLLGLRNRDILQHHEAQYVTRATLLAQQRMSELETIGFPPLGILSGDFPEPDEVYHWTQTVIPTPFDFAREVQMEVGWKQGRDGGSVSLVTFMMKENP